MRHWLLAIVLGLVAAGGPTLAAAQETAGDRVTLTGVVRDAQGRALPQVSVTIRALERAAATDPQGAYRLDNLVAGMAVVEVRAIGYQAVRRTVQLRRNAPNTVDVALEPAVAVLAPVVVTGTPAGSTTLTPLDVAVLAPEQLAAVATASLGKTLAAVPGVSSLAQGPAAGNPVLRGLSQGHIKIIRDGVPQENFQATARWVPPGNLAAVERIEVVRGPASVLYGPNAVGGAINLIPKAIPRTEAAGMLRGLAEAQYFDNDAERYGHAELFGAGGPGLGFRAGASRRVGGNFRVPDVPTFAESGQAKAPRFSGELPNTNFEQTEAYGQVGITRGPSNAYVNYDRWTGSNNFLNADGTPTGVRMANHDLRLRGNVFTRGFVVKPVLLYQRAGILRNTTARTFEQSAAENSWNQDLVNDARTGRVEILHPAVAGLRGTIGAEYNRQSVMVAKSAIEPASLTRNLAVFAFEERQFSRLNVPFGIRLDSRHLTASANPLVSRLPADQQSAALDRRYTAVTGSAGAGFRVTDAVTLAVNGSIGFRPPAPLDLYSDEYRPALLAFVEGDPTLSPEHAYSLESSLRAQSRRFSGSAVLYRTRLNGYAYLSRTSRTRLRNGQRVPVYVNQQTDGRITGFELSVNAEPVRGLLLDGSYSRLRSRNLSSGEQLPLMPADHARLALRYARPRLSVLTGPFIEVNGRHVWAKQIAGVTEPFADAEANPSGPGVGSTTAYSLVGVAAGARLGQTGVELGVSAENLLNTAYRDFLDTLKGIALGQGRTVSVRLSVPLALVGR